jgi:hypothetical protein
MKGKIFNMIRSTIVSVLLISMTVFSQTGKTVIGIYTNTASVENTASVFDSPEFEVLTVTNDSAADFCSDGQRVLVVPCDEIIHHSIRETLNDYLRNSGSIMILNPYALSYENFTVSRKIEIEDRQNLCDFNDKESFEIVKKKESGLLVDICSDKSGQKNVIMHTANEIGGSAFVQVPVNFEKELTSLCLEIQAKGTVQFDILTAKLIDKEGNEWIGFSSLDENMSVRTIALADMLGADGNEMCISELAPQDIRYIQVGLDKRVIWGEAGGRVRIGSIAAAFYNTDRYLYSQNTVRFRSQFRSVGSSFPQWLFELVPSVEERVLESGSRALSLGRSRPNPGGNTESYLDVIKRTAARYIPLIQKTDAKGELADIARIDLYNDGPFAGASVLLYAGGKDLLKQQQTRKMLRDKAIYMAHSPKILDLTPDTKPSKNKDEYDFVVNAYIHNPLTRNIKANTSVDIAEGTVRGSSEKELVPGEITKMVINCGAVEEDFPFTKFDINVRTQTSAGNDQIKETIDVEATLKRASEQLIEMQKVNFEDWAYTHWFYSDAYAARMLRAFGEHTDEQNYINSAMRWADMTALAQLEGGAYPMGYGMKWGIYYIADNGSIALAIAQLASYADDIEKKALLESLRSAFNWRAGYKVTSQRAQELTAEYGEGAKGTQQGNYGVGIVLQDHVTGTGRYDSARPEYRGVWYTLACTMGFPAALADITGEGRYYEAANADARFYIDTALTCSDSYAPEGLVWLHAYLKDERLKAELEKMIREKFIGYFPKAAERFWLYGGSRQTLLVGALAHSMHNIENSTLTRSAMLESVIGLCGQYSPYSMLRVAADFPKATYSKANNEATMYLNFGSFGLMELLVPGSTMLKETECEK